MTRSYHAQSEEATAAAGREIARALSPNAVVHLQGDLGAGKTFLVKVMAGELGATPDEVSSPSFALIHEYPRQSGPPIIHIDGYRLSDEPREWMEIGIPEIMTGEGVKFIEWPKEGFRRYAPGSVTIEMRVNEDDSRTIRVEGID